ncbi:MAG: hypothetical protein IJ456_10595 [Bacteroides sp.]|nr:hypothetical protein [Bacteroides sp.]
MKNIRILGILLLVFVMCSAFSFKKKGSKQVYLVGVSASFTDSLVYFTDVQTVDSIELDKNDMLPQRQQYSYQLKTYLEAKTGQSNRTCFVYFGHNKAKLEKSIKKMKNNYLKGGKAALREVDSDFKFTKAEIY